LARRAASYYVRWGSGALEVRVASERMEVIGGNGSIVFEPRSVEVNVPYAGKRDVEDRNRRTVFVEFREELRPVSNPPRVDIVGRNYVGNFELVYTDLEFEKYLTIITPATFLYDYAVVTTRDLMLYMQAKRKVYFEEEPFDKITVYIA
jgi:hypothetical protein